MDIDANVLSQMSATYGLDSDIIAALVEVESNGIDHWVVTLNGKTAKLPVIRFEGHYFYKRLSGAELKTAIAQGLANPKVGGVKNPTSSQGRYNLLERAMKVNREAALESISIGVGQVMGANWKMLGFKSASDMFVSVCKDPTVAHQIDLMCRFIVANATLKKAVQRKDCATIALYYNGKAYKKYGYDKKLEAALIKQRRLHHVPTPVAPAQPSVDVSDGAGVVPDSEWLKDIHDLGYKDVNSFQQENGLVPDGKIGPVTIDAIKSKIATKAASAAAPARKTGTVLSRIGAIGISSITAAIEFGQGIRDQANDAFNTIAGWIGPDATTYVGYALTAVAFGGVLYYIFIKERAGDKDAA